MTLGSGDSNGCMNFAWGLCWGESRSRTLCVFRVRWLQAVVKGTLLTADRVGAQRRLSQANAALVRNAIAESEHLLPDLLREVP